MNLKMIIEFNQKIEEVEVRKDLTTVGSDDNYDLQIPLPFEGGFSILKRGQNYKLMAFNKKVEKSLKGHWDQDCTGVQSFQSSNLKIVFYPVGKDSSPEKIKDWDYENLPKDYRCENYPFELLDFVIESHQITKGALFLKRGNFTHCLAKKNLKLRDQSMQLVTNFIEESNESVLELNFDTHTLLFNAGLEPENFLLIRHSLYEEGEVILYIPKGQSEIPKGILTTLLYLLSRSLSLHLSFKNNKRVLKRITGEKYHWGQSEKMTAIKRQVDRMAKTDLSLLIHGETGTGKEGIAEYIAGLNPGSPFVAVNCATINQNIAESLLFGHKKGSFTDAHSDQIGMIERANHGILFLDEIGELDLNIQAKLLRFLQNGTITPLGGAEKKVKVRLLCATHKDLRAEIQHKNFREDLYYRINEVTVQLPPLRQRVEDIQALAEIFLMETIKNNHLPPMAFSSDFIGELQRRCWKGNIRELRSFIRKQAILCEGEVISLGQTSTAVPQKESAFPDTLNEAKEIFIRQHIQKVLQRTQGNRQQTAEILDINERTLYRLMAKFPDKEDSSLTEMSGSQNTSYGNYVPTLGKDIAHPSDVQPNKGRKF